MEIIIIRPIAYYTVALIKGFPIYFKCPGCNEIHSFPENPEKSTFQDPGESSSFFKTAFSILADWQYLEEEKFLEKVNG